MSERRITNDQDIYTDKGIFKNWDRLGFDDKDLRRLELELLRDPSAYPVIKGTGGLRKIRFSFEKDNLPYAERNDIKKMIEILKASLQEMMIWVVYMKVL